MYQIGVNNILNRTLFDFVDFTISTEAKAFGLDCAFTEDDVFSFWIVFFLQIYQTQICIYIYKYVDSV